MAVSHWKHKLDRRSAETVHIQSGSSTHPLCFHTAV